MPDPENLKAKPSVSSFFSRICCFKPAITVSFRFWSSGVVSLQLISLVLFLALQLSLQVEVIVSLSALIVLSFVALSECDTLSKVNCPRKERTRCWKLRLRQFPLLRLRASFKARRIRRAGPHRGHSYYRFTDRKISTSAFSQSLLRWSYTQRRATIIHRTP